MEIKEKQIQNRCQEALFFFFFPAENHKCVEWPTRLDC